MNFLKQWDSAFSLALNRIKNNSDIVEKKIVSYPEKIALTIQANSESEALSITLKGIPLKKAINTSVNKREVGKKGFLKIGKTINIYEVSYFQNAHIEIIAKTKSKVKGKIGPFPNRPPTQFRIWSRHKSNFFPELNYKISSEALLLWYTKYDFTLAIDYSTLLYDNRHAGDTINRSIYIEIFNYLKQEKGLIKILDGDPLNKEKFSSEEDFVIAIISKLAYENDDYQLLFHYKGVALLPDWD